jgi:hypothetical protein
MDQIRRVLNHATQWRASTEVIAEINSVMRGWSGYFRYGHGRAVLGQMHDLISARLRTWLWKKSRCSHAKYGYYTRKRLREQYGLYAMNQATTGRAV